MNTSTPASTRPQNSSYESWTRSNLGIVAPEHQAILRDARILIAGTGAEGSSTAICLARLGVGHFRLADIDCFEDKNLNRQFGCYQDTLGTSKVDAVAGEIRRINPAAEVEVAPEGVTAENAQALVDGASCVVGGLDMYAPEAGLALDLAARAAKLFIVTGISLGFRNDIYVFSPDGMSAVEYCLEAFGRGQYPFIPTDPPPAGFPMQLANDMKALFEGIPDPTESIEAALAAFMEKVANSKAKLDIPAIAPTVFLTGARTAIEVYGLLTGTREPVLAPSYTSVDLLNVTAGIVRS